ncbi:MAG TPA: tryptophan--tRNA ligase [Streptosporangiaceae bacterium]|nr:tryptophan--tRNA ligase [Streptosporangiaceae bacterium]
MPVLTSSTIATTPPYPGPAGATPSVLASRDRTAVLEQAIVRDPHSFRILTGERPTGALHLGHYFGSQQNRVRLQNAGVELLVLIADYQAITDRTAAADLPDIVIGLVADYLALGIDPERATIFAHSQVEPLNQLLLPFLSLVSVAEIGRNPTVKDEIAAAGSPTVSGLMFSYPVHQAADILFCRANLVPVGQDQLPHIELTRTIARRFNERYSPDAPYFPEPEGLLSSAPLLLGTDGRKMSKSRNNSVPLRATADETARLVSKAKTDSQRQISYEPQRRPEVSNLVLLTALCRETTPETVVAEIGDGGAAALKSAAIDAINDRFAGLRARRAALAADPGYLRDVLAAGNEKAHAIATRTLAAVRELMHQRY